MGCITKLLDLKGEKEFIKSPTTDGVIIEGGGTYKGYEYLIILNDMAFRCAYVAVAQDHPVCKSKDSYLCDLELDVHGGVTFFDSPHLVKTECNDKWIGFDAGHLYDRIDINTAKKYFGEENESMKYLEKTGWDERFSEIGSTIKSFDYMESECKKLIDQLAS